MTLSFELKSCERQHAKILNKAADDHKQELQTLTDVVLKLKNDYLKKTATTLKEKVVEQMKNKTEIKKEAPSADQSQTIANLRQELFNVQNELKKSQDFILI